MGGYIYIVSSRFTPLSMSMQAPINSRTSALLVLLKLTSEDIVALHSIRHQDNISHDDYLAQLAVQVLFVYIYTSTSEKIENLTN